MVDDEIRGKLWLLRLNPAGAGVPSKILTVYVSHNASDPWSGATSDSSTPANGFRAAVAAVE